MVLLPIENNYFIYVTFSPYFWETPIGTRKALYRLTCDIVMTCQFRSVTAYTLLSWWRQFVYYLRISKVAVSVPVLLTHQ